MEARRREKERRHEFRKYEARCMIVEVKEREDQNPRRGYPIHPLAQAMPEMPETEFQAFMEDIRQNGQLDPIEILDNMVWDGLHRQRACLELEIEPRYVFLEEDTDPLQRILSKTRFRRHATQSQMAIAAAKIYLMSHKLAWSGKEGTENAGSEFAKLQISPLTQDLAASRFGVSKRMFIHAMKLYEPGSNANDSLNLAAEQGLLKVSDASHVVDEPIDVQDAAIGLVLQGKDSTISKALRRVHRGRAQPTVVDAPSLEPWQSARGDVTLYNCRIGELQALVPAHSVDAIITVVPDEDGETRTLRGLASFAAHALKPDGVMLMLCRVTSLPGVFRSLQHGDLKFLLEIDYRFDVPVRKLSERHAVGLRRMPPLVWGKPEFVLKDGDDVLQLPEPKGDSTDLAMGQRHADGADLMVRRFTQTGDVVCDPLLLIGTTAALAALRLGRHFVGSCHDGGRFQHVREAFIREDERRRGG